MGNFVLAWPILVVPLIISAWVAFKRDAALRRRYPEVKPFVWGYFVGMAGIQAGAVLCFIEVFTAPQVYGRPSDFCVVIAGVLFACIHILMMMMRLKWAWVVGIILHLNPILWMVNGVYLTRRWDEMSAMPGVDVGERLTRASVANRALVAGSMFWALLVVTFIVVFEPYGPDLGSGECWQIVKVIFFLPLVAVAGHWLYVNVVRRECKGADEEQTER